ncbi:MAG: hypothetical protein N2747_00035 [Chitinophagaceae bacterium]|nr:hypothetical protein [Chitinophagaceae bacterium]
MTYLIIKHLRRQRYKLKHEKEMSSGNCIGSDTKGHGLLWFDFSGQAK